MMQACYANFVKTGDPNGEGAPTWPAANGGGEVQVMVWDVESKVEPERNRERYLFHDRFLAAQGGVRGPAALSTEIVLGGAV